MPDPASPPVRPPASRFVSLEAAFAVQAILLGAFVGVPLIALAARAVEDREVLDAITTPFVLQALRLSLVTSTLTLALALVLGVPAAYLLARSRFRGHRLVALIVELPMVLPPTVAGVGLLVAFGRQGLLGGWLAEVGLSIPFTTTAVVLAQLFVSAPFLVRSLQAGFESVDPVYEQVAATLGLSPLAAFWRVVLPLVRPSLISGAILCWTRALSELGATLIFAGSFEGRTQTMPLAIIRAFESSSGLTGAIALSAILLVVATVLLLAVHARSVGPVTP